MKRLEDFGRTCRMPVLCAIVLALVASACVPLQTVETTLVPVELVKMPDPDPRDDEIAELYARIPDYEADYDMGIDLLAAGDEVFGELRIADAANGLRDATSACTEIPGCEVRRFLDAFDRLLSRQEIQLKYQAARILALEESAQQDVEREPGTSPIAVHMPELSRTASLLRGTDLREIIELNGPVQAALHDWLTWMRPMLMQSYENYQFLRTKIAPIYEDAGLPEALLFGMIATETGGRVHAFSRAGAAGLLQFIRSTGRRYGLDVVDGFDLRLDPVEATRANVGYLNDLFAELNDSLELSLAAYNGGENRIHGLQRKYGKVGLWDRQLYFSLPRETREYVPRILAAAWLFLHADDYNLELTVPETATTMLELEHEMSLGELTVCLGQHENANGWFRTLRNLNPRLEPRERVAAGRQLELPSILVEAYYESCLEGEVVDRSRKLHEAQYPDEEEMIPYQVRRKDTLGKIAARHGCVSLQELAALNGVRAPRYTIHVGQELKIPNCQ